MRDKLGWKLKNKRRQRWEYWDDFGNLKQDFGAESGWPLSEPIPSKSDLNQAVRSDLRRAVEK